MKNSILVIFLTLCVAATVFAAESIQTKALFTAKDTTAYSSVVNTGLFTKKTVIANGIYASGVYGNYSGTFRLECAPTATGPWQTCKDKGNNSVTATNSNVTFHLDDLVQYVRAYYLQSKHKLTVWLFYAK